MSPEPADVIHLESRQRFEMQLESMPVAYLTYRREGSRTVFDHVYVPAALRGKGIAAVLARSALLEARERGWQVVPTCSYIASYIERHDEFRDLVES